MLQYDENLCFLIKFKLKILYSESHYACTMPYNVSYKNSFHAFHSVTSLGTQCERMPHNWCQLIAINDTHVAECQFLVR